MNIKNIKILKDVKKIAAFIRPLNITVDYLFHSGKTRAQQTAEILAKQLNSSIKISKTVDLKPLDDPLIWVEHLAKKTEDIIIDVLKKINGFDLAIFYLKIDKGLSYQKMNKYLAISHNALFKRMNKIYKMIKDGINENESKGK